MLDSNILHVLLLRRQARRGIITHDSALHRRCKHYLKGKLEAFCAAAKKDQQHHPCTGFACRTHSFFCPDDAGEEKFCGH